MPINPHFAKRRVPNIQPNHYLQYFLKDDNQKKNF